MRAPALRPLLSQGVHPALPPLALPPSRASLARRPRPPARPHSFAPPSLNHHPTSFPGPLPPSLLAVPDFLGCAPALVYKLVLCGLYFIINLMDCDSDSDDSYSSSLDSVVGRPARGNGSVCEQLISLNLTIFTDMGFTVAAHNFTRGSRPREEREQQGDSDSDHSEIDYGDSEEQSPEEEAEDGFEEEGGLEAEEWEESRQSASDEWQMHEWEGVSESSESPFFAGAVARQQAGLSEEEIGRIPTMKWGNAHNAFNRGEKCGVCLEDFQLGNDLRVMECLHRYHLDCLDQWLALRPTCPSCRSHHPHPHA